MNRNSSSLYKTLGLVALSLPLISSPASFKMSQSGPTKAKIEQVGERIPPSQANLNQDSVRNATFPGDTRSEALKDSAHIDTLIRKMWDDKRYMANNKEAVDSLIEQRVQNFESEKTWKVTLDEYVDIIKNDLTKIKNNLQKDDLYEEQELNEAEQTFVEEFDGCVDAEMFTSYFMAETVGSTNAEVNKNTFENYLKAGGLEFVHLIPSLNDNLVSFGEGQLTSRSVGDYPTYTGSANRIIHNIDGVTLPNHISELEGTDHFKANIAAAYIKAAETAKALDKQTLARVNQHMTKENCLAIVAGNHYNPKGLANTIDEIPNDEALTLRIATRHTGLSNYTNKVLRNYVGLSDDVNIEDHFQKIDEDEGFHYFQPDRTVAQFNPHRLADIFDALNGKREYQKTGNLNVITEQGQVYEGVGEKQFKARPK